MGLTQSSRKLTIANDDTKLITVSTAVVERLTQGVTDDSVNQPIEEQDTRVTHVAAPRLTQQSVPAPVYNSANSPVSHKSDSPVHYLPEYTLSALEIQQQKERELQDQDQYWQKRLKNLERNHALIDQIFNEEHKKAVEEFVNKKGYKDQIRGKITPCLETSELVLKCYQEHPKEILKCADLVEQFSSCVEQRRAQVIAAR